MQALASAQAARLDALRTRHSTLSQKIKAAQSRPATADWYLKDLKVQKLRLKEEIEGIAKAG